jgi:ubiquinol-cytochrome c reductase cytochrome b subunit
MSSIVLALKAKRSLDKMNLQFILKLSAGLSFLFLSILILSGWGLSGGYIPSESEAFSSILYLRKMGGVGQMIRSLHFYLSSGLIISGFIFLMTFYLNGYTSQYWKQWVLSLSIYFLIIGSCFTGYLLPMDQNAFWGTQVRLGIVESVPVIGVWIANLLRGGSTIGSETLSRFITIHASIIPIIVSIITLLLIQSQWEFIKTILSKTSILFGTIIGLVLIYFWTYSVSAPLELPANPIDVDYTPRPEWYFLWLFEFGKYVEWAPWIRSALLPMAGTLFLLGLPFLKHQATNHRIGIAVSWCGTWLLLTSLTLYADRDLPEKLNYESAMFVQAEENYQSLCYDCHGKEGKGDGPQTKTFSLETPDFTSKTYWRGTDDDKILNAIKEGKGKDRPDFKRKLSKDQIYAQLEMMKILFKPKK